jgi:hypothetical protein
MARVVSVVATIFSAVFIGLTIQTFNQSYYEDLTDDIPKSQSKLLERGPTRIQKFSKNWFAALVAVGCFIASPYVVQWSSLARIDSLALAFATGALFIFARWRDNRWGWIFGGLLLVAAAYTRQSYLLAAPLAAFIWLWHLNKRRAIGLVLFVGAIGLGLFVILNLITHGGFFYNIVTANVNEFGWERLMDHLTNLWHSHYILLLLGLLFLVIGWRIKPKTIQVNPWWLIAPFLLGAFLSGLTIGKIGSNINYFLELSAALALTAGILIIWSRSYPWRNAALIFLLAIQIGLLLEAAMEEAVDWGLTPRLQDFASLQLLEQEVKRMPGEVLADEYMGLLTMNDRPLYIQPFEVSQLANAGMWYQQPLLDEIRNQQFDGILIHHFSPWPVHKERWTAEMLKNIEENYRPVKTLAGTVIHIPQGETGISHVPQPVQILTTPTIKIGPETPINAASFVTEPMISVHPSDPNILAAIVTSVSKQACDLPNCIVEMTYFLSNDEGETWEQKANFSWSGQVAYNGEVVFDTFGRLNILGVRDNMIMVNQTDETEDYVPKQSGFEEVTRAQVNARPWLFSHPATGTLFLTMDAQEGDMRFVTPSLIRSDDHVNWSLIVRADQHISFSDINSPRATGPGDIQVLFDQGDNLSLVWVWDSEPWGWPRTVWMANSTDGGQTLGEPAPILETWGPINATSANGIYAIAYRTGDEQNQQIAVATSSDQGATWYSSIASGEMALPFEGDKGPGIAVSPSGTIDLVFYTPENPSDECLLDLESWQQALPFGRIDPCEYALYYTYSTDDGSTFSDPVKINDQVVRGDDFVRFMGGSQVGSRLSVASSDDFAYPIWIGTPSEGKTQIFGVKIER